MTEGTDGARVVSGFRNAGRRRVDVERGRVGRGRGGFQGGGEGGLLGGYAEAADELAGEVLQGGRGGGAAVVGVRPDVQGEQVVEDLGELRGGYVSGAIGESGAGKLIPFGR